MKSFLPVMSQSRERACLHGTDSPLPKRRHPPKPGAILLTDNRCPLPAPIGALACFFLVCVSTRKANHDMEPPSEEFAWSATASLARCRWDYPPEAPTV